MQLSLEQSHLQKPDIVLLTPGQKAFRLFQMVLKIFGFQWITSSYAEIKNSQALSPFNSFHMKSVQGLNLEVRPNSGSCSTGVIVPLDKGVVLLEFEQCGHTELVLEHPSFCPSESDKPKQS